jgi:hypothetical protein
MMLAIDFRMVPKDCSGLSYRVIGPWCFESWGKKEVVARTVRTGL